MAELKQKTPLYKVGDKVRTVAGLVGLVAQVHGTYSPTGYTRYSVRVPMEAGPLRLEVREEEIESAPDAAMPGPGVLPPACARVAPAPDQHGGDSQAVSPGTPARPMPTQKIPRYKVGEKVRIVTGLVGLVKEVSGLYGTGNILYLVRVPMDSEPLIALVREEEIEKV